MIALISALPARPSCLERAHPLLQFAVGRRNPVPLRRRQHAIAAARSRRWRTDRASAMRGWVKLRDPAGNNARKLLSFEPGLKPSALALVALLALDTTSRMRLRSPPSAPILAVSTGSIGREKKRPLTVPPSILALACSARCQARYFSSGLTMSSTARQHLVGEVEPFHSRLRPPRDTIGETGERIRAAGRPRPFETRIRLDISRCRRSVPPARDSHPDRALCSS